MTDIVVALGSAVPVYEQIRAQVAAAVAVGTLKPGDRLPASRDLARDLGIAVGTVQRAYKELEASGVVESRRRTGTVIAPGAGGVSGSGVAGPPAAVVAQAHALVAVARKARVPDDAVLDLVRGALAAG
ncbi:transcriptional regulator, GntR family [Xylanimonas cellulosilytica DSM 15894]|uniref:Transcriptional regulator, GntR family n=1 Tax=Xylanimonas cellulosilytica (strain DSM 15894 / JCM 12276 / CECT 5975 / KCTC 9989 / LMG 20990 / NBRC 107835 / XIL07) TaxID=446471 RepID=D1BVQ2_XYLCX|nr:GntR family transcriptional regulator [Xylanimonas cellulosilytica]ACZ31371.1 transcriptional regulator, GntR family [Xylanimonas cellulosilytica DSM 15894]